MAFKIIFTACTMACFTLSGCAANELMLKRQDEAEAKLEYIMKSDKKNQQQINEHVGQLQTLDEQIRSCQQQNKQTRDTLQELILAQEENKARMTLLAQQLTTPKVEIIHQESTHQTTDIGLPPEYVKAFGLYSANNFKAAINAFEAFLKNSPESEYAANAQYWIGECHYSLSDLPSALTFFTNVVVNHPKSAKAPDAMLKQGYTLAAMKQKQKAAIVYETLTKSYPSSPAAAKAREHLTAN